VGATGRSFGFVRRLCFGRDELGIRALSRKGEFHPFRRARDVGNLQLIDESLVSVAHFDLSFDGGRSRAEVAGANLSAVDIEGRLARPNGQYDLSPGRGGNLTARDLDRPDIGPQRAAGERDVEWTLMIESARGRIG